MGDKKIVYVKPNVIHDMIDSNNDKNIIIIQDNTPTNKLSKTKQFLNNHKKKIMGFITTISLVLLSAIVDSRISNIIVREQSINNLVLKYMKNNDDASNKTLTLFVTSAMMRIKERLKLFDDSSSRPRYLIHANITESQWDNWQSYRYLELTLFEKQLEWSLLVNSKKTILESIEDCQTIDIQSSEFRELVNNTALVVYSSLNNDLNREWQELNGVNLYNTFLNGSPGSPLELPFMTKDLKNSIESIYIIVINNNKELSKKTDEIRGGDLKIWLLLKKYLQ